MRSTDDQVNQNQLDLHKIGPNNENAELRRKRLGKSLLSLRLRAAEIMESAIFLHSTKKMA